MTGGSTTGAALEVASSPHVRSGDSVERIMLHVVLALLPVSGFAVWAFGMAALLVLLTAVASCVLAEHLLCRAAGRESTVSDWSAVITGLLLGLTLPPGLPLWMVAVGGLIAIAVGKHLFGGLGYNVFNPALVGRAVLQAAFPIALTTWHAPLHAHRFTGVPASTLTWPLCAPSYDAVSGPTPLAAWKFERIATATTDLLTGTTSGSLGETCALLILAGGLYLVLRRMMNWRIPVAMLSAVAVLAGALHLIDPSRYASPQLMLLSGGVMLGAVFMASDMVGSPMTHPGAALYGATIGVLVVVIRTWAGMPEGVMYAILLGNALTPHLDNLVRPRVYGTARRDRR